MPTAKTLSPTPCKRGVPFPTTTLKALRAYRPPEGYRVFVTGANFCWGQGATGAEALKEARRPSYFRAWIYRGDLSVDSMFGGPTVTGEGADLQRLGERTQKRR